MSSDDYLEIGSHRARSAIASHHRRTSTVAICDFKRLQGKDQQRRRRCDPYRRRGSYGQGKEGGSRVRAWVGFGGGGRKVMNLGQGASASPPRPLSSSSFDHPILKMDAPHPPWIRTMPCWIGAPLEAMGGAQRRWWHRGQLVALRRRHWGRSTVRRRQLYRGWDKGHGDSQFLFPKMRTSGWGSRVGSWVGVVGELEAERLGVWRIAV